MIYAFTVTRANTPARIDRLRQTVRQARKRAGADFFWTLCASGVDLPTISEVDQYIPFKTNVGQHVAWNTAYDHCKQGNYRYFLRIDDDCDFLTYKWLKKLVRISKDLDDKMILAPVVRGLNNPPARTEELDVKGHKIAFLMAAIGGVCRLHPIELLDKYDYVSDVRLSLGAGDATGIASWCRENTIPMAYTYEVRVRHSTSAQIREDPEYFKNHQLYQRVPYIPCYKK